ncbi:hypothetical protein ACHAWF_004348, partial [Thalassiosira exigua]
MQCSSPSLAHEGRLRMRRVPHQGDPAFRGVRQVQVLPIEESGLRQAPGWRLFYQFPDQRAVVPGAPFELFLAVLVEDEAAPPRQVVAALRRRGVGSQAEGPAVRVRLPRADHVETPGNAAIAQHDDDPPPAPVALRFVHQFSELGAARDLGLSPPAVYVAKVVLVCLRLRVRRLQESRHHLTTHGRVYPVAREQSGADDLGAVAQPRGHFAFGLNVLRQARPAAKLAHARERAPAPTRIRGVLLLPLVVFPPLAEELPKEESLHRRPARAIRLRVEGRRPHLVVLALARSEVADVDAGVPGKDALDVQPESIPEDRHGRRREVEPAPGVGAYPAQRGALYQDVRNAAALFEDESGEEASGTCSSDDDRLLSFVGCCAVIVVHDELSSFRCPSCGGD